MTTKQINFLLQNHPRTSARCIPLLKSVHHLSLIEANDNYCPEEQLLDVTMFCNQAAAAAVAASRVGVDLGVDTAAGIGKTSGLCAAADLVSSAVGSSPSDASSGATEARCTAWSSGTALSSSTVGSSGTYISAEASYAAFTPEKVIDLDQTPPKNQTTLVILFLQHCRVITAPDKKNDLVAVKITN
eukprot:8284180-Ditylum_brightwellii.AAC.1